MSRNLALIENRIAFESRELLQELSGASWTVCARIPGGVHLEPSIRLNPRRCELQGVFFHSHEK